MAGAEDEIGVAVDVELLLQRGLDVDLGQHAEPLARQSVPAALHGLVEGEIGLGLVGDGGFPHGLGPFLAVLPGLSRPPGPRASAGSGEAAGTTAGGGRAALGGLARVAREGRVLLVERFHAAPGADQTFRPLSHALEDLEAVVTVAAAVFVDWHRQLLSHGKYLRSSAATAHPLMGGMARPGRW